MLRVGLPIGVMTATETGAKVHKVVYNKFYVDELYEATILKPFRFAAKFLYDVVDPYLRLFRRLLPQLKIGGLGLDLGLDFDLTRRRPGLRLGVRGAHR